VQKAIRTVRNSKVFNELTIKERKQTKMDKQNEGKQCGSTCEVRAPNDDRSDSKNPNNPASKAAADNKSNQQNPNNPSYDKVREANAANNPPKK
jgi:hypothetical protein